MRCTWLTCMARGGAAEAADLHSQIKAANGATAFKHSWTDVPQDRMVSTAALSTQGSPPQTSADPELGWAAQEEQGG